MRKLVFGAALILVGFGGSAAFGGGPRVGNGGPDYGHGNFGVGGWNQHFGAGGWAPKSGPSSTASSFSAMGPATGSSGSAPAVGNGGVGSGEIYYPLPNPLGHRSAGQVAHPLPLLQKDAECVFRSQETPDGNRWRPGCK